MRYVYTAGFALEQLLPSYGTPQGEFNRGIYNRHLGLSHRAHDKYTSMVKPFTTNGYVSGSVNINTVQSYAGKGANAATPDHSPFAPMYNLGAIRRKAFVDQTSDSLIAAKQPAKFDYPYLVIYSNIVPTPQYIGGDEGNVNLPAVAYVGRSYTTGDFFYGDASSWAAGGHMAQQDAPRSGTPGIAALLPETSGVAFEDGSARHDVDVVLYATGYRVTFPFFASFDGEEEASNSLREASASHSASLAPRSVDNRVAPLFEHVFPPASGPSLSFIGLPWKVVPFPQFEAQARWVARALSGAAALPGRAEMASRAAAAEAADRGAGVADRHAHRMGDAQFAYNDRLLAYCGEPSGFPKWREAMYAATGARKRAFPTSYRDGPDEPWSDEEALAEARAEAAALELERSSSA